MTKKLDFFGKKRAYNRDANRHIVKNAHLKTNASETMLCAQVLTRN